MKRPLEAFAQFVNENEEFDDKDREQLAKHLQLLLDSDPEKVVLRQALQYYANEHNWPYEMHSPDGICITGMEAEEAIDIARHALIASDQLKQEILIAMRQGVDTKVVLKGHARSSA